MGSEVADEDTNQWFVNRPKLWAFGVNPASGYEF